MKRILFAGVMLALLCFAFTYKNERTITGTVKDQNGDLVPFATITAKGMHTSVAADANANFRITVDDKTKVLVVTAVGLQTEEVQLTDATNYNVVMKRNSSSLNDVVVTTGLGIQRAPLSTGYSTLQGKISGIQIRGTKSYKNSSPKIVADEQVSPEEKPEDDSWRYNDSFNTEGYDHIVENPFLKNK